VLDLLQVYDVGFGDLLQSKDFFRRTDDLLDSAECPSAQRLRNLVFRDVIRVTILLDWPFGFGLTSLRIGSKGRADLLLLPLFLQLLQFVEE
jgi:hypothetical protein